MSDSEWMKRINEILKRHRFRSGKVFVRFNATRYPHPTIAIVIYDNGRKVLEKPIKFFDDFVNDLLLVKSIIDEVKISKPLEENKNKPVLKSESFTHKTSHQSKTPKKIKRS